MAIGDIRVLVPDDQEPVRKDLEQMNGVMDRTE